MITIARLAGFGTPACDAARVLEIGCGDGGNLLPLAYYHPAWSFVGVDPSAEAIRIAELGRHELGMSNLSFVQANAATAVLDGKFDFVICHGVYSWVAPGERDSVIALAKERLSPQGLFYLSYNTEPGWRSRGLVRERLRKRTKGGSVLEQAEAAREELEVMSELLGSGEGHPYLSLLRREIDFAKDKPLFHLAHEYLAEHNRAFWFGEVWDAADSHGLHYVGDAQDYRVEGAVSPEQKELARQHSRDRREREESLDLVCYRQMRASLFCLAARSESEVDAAEVLRLGTLHSCLRPAVAPVNLGDDIAAVFLCPYTQRQVQAASPFGKAALLTLAQVYPQGLSADALLLRVEAILPEEDDRDSSAELLEFLQGFAQLHGLGLVEARAVDVQEWVSAQPPAVPRLHRLAKYEAEHRAYLTSPVHDSLPIDAIDREVVRHMDGEHDTDLLITIAEEEGCTDGEARVTRLHQTLSLWGLLA